MSLEGTFPRCSCAALAFPTTSLPTSARWLADPSSSTPASSATRRKIRSLQTGGIYVFHADTEGLNFRRALVESGFKLAQCCVWVKQAMVMGRQDYHWQHEPVLYGWKPTGPHHWYFDRKQTTLWNFDRPMRNGEHPTMKPVALIEYPIRNSSRQGDIVVDLFGGSGSTLLACEKNARICRSMELDPKYCDVILQRWSDFTGKEPVRQDGAQWNAVKQPQSDQAPATKRRQQKH